MFNVMVGVLHFSCTSNNCKSRKVLTQTMLFSIMPQGTNIMQSFERMGTQLKSAHLGYMRVAGVCVK